MEIPFDYSVGYSLPSVDYISPDRFVEIVQMVGYAISGILFILAIAFLVKSIIDFKKLKAGNLEGAVNSIKVTSIVLLIINILTACSNFIMLVMSIISLVFVSGVKKLIPTDTIAATGKARVSGILNIVITSLMVGGAIFTAIGSVMFATIWSIASIW